MGVMIKSTSLAAALRQAKRQPTRLLRCLMVELFSEDELRCCTVKGKKSSLPGLDRDIMDTILCKLIEHDLIVFHCILHIKVTQWQKVTSGANQ